MPRRRGARKLALDILYEHEVGQGSLEAILARYAKNPAFDFAQLLVRGVIEHKAEIDALITKHAVGWDIERMPAIDRSLLRMGLFEMLHEEDVPTAVAINETVELAKIYSTADSSRYLNGILGKVASEQV